MPGIDTSITMTSGRHSIASCTAAAPSLASRTTVHVVLAFDQQLQAVPDGDVVVGEQDRGGAWVSVMAGRRVEVIRRVVIRNSTVVPFPVADSICSVAPTSAARSCMPSRPKPRRLGGGPGRIESDAVVFDDQHDLVAAAFEDHVHARGP